MLIVQAGASCKHSPRVPDLPWPAELTWSSSPRAPGSGCATSALAETLRSHTQGHSTQPGPLGNHLIPFPFPHRSSAALQTISFSPKPAHNILADSEGHMTAFSSQKLPTLVLETGAGALFCCLRAPHTEGMPKTP